MAPQAGHGQTAAAMAGGAVVSGDLFRLIRYSHIFASAVREVLELKLLEDVGAKELSLPQFHLLQLISFNGRHQIGEVADFLGVSPPAATKSIDKLERLGLVARTPCVVDRRATLLASSAKGRQLVRRYESLKKERLVPLLEAFSANELRQLIDMLARFSTALIQGTASHDGLCLRCSAYFDDKCPIQHLHCGCPYQKISVHKRADRGAAAENRPGDG